MSLNEKDLEKLKVPFDEQTIGVKVQSTSKNRDKAMLVLYVQHTDVAARLDSVDPAWSAEITDERQAGDFFATRMRITLKGVTRENVGEGQDPKSAASDALKRTAMLFGVARYLYDSETVWVPYNEQTDKYKAWTYAEYKNALRKPTAPKPTGPSAAVHPLTSTVTAKALNRMQMGTEIIKLARQLGVDDLGLADWVQNKFKKTNIQALTDAELATLLDEFQFELGRLGEPA